MFRTVLFVLPLIAAGRDDSQVPGVVVAHSPASSGQYIGSPSLAILPSGDCVISHDLFGPGSTRDQTRVFGSKDRGKTWQPRAALGGQWWSTLFVHQGALYVFGTSKERGDTVIRRSTDGGHTWTTPTDTHNGRLLIGSYHCAPVPVVVHGGRLWRAMEDASVERRHMRAFMMSAAADADLLRAASWTSSNRLDVDLQWLDGKFAGWLEGNAVVTPEGTVVDILRVEHAPQGDYAARVEISADGTRATFDPATGFLAFPGGSKKFTIRHDPQSRLYWALSNPVRGPHPGVANSGMVRNTLALMSSPDLRTWTVRAIVLHHPDAKKHAFQYTDWQFDGDDSIVASRTAFDDELGGAHTQHDANYLTFHRIEHFRNLRQNGGPR